MPLSLQYLIIFSTPPGILRQLYVIAPIWTPPNLELGLSEASASAATGVLLLQAYERGTIVKAAAAAVLPRNFLREILFPVLSMFFISYWV
jgi:hypothetical protein